MTFKQWLARRKRHALVARIAATWGARDALLELEIDLRRQLHAHDAATGQPGRKGPPTKLATRQRLEVDGEPVEIPRTLKQAFGDDARLEVERYNRFHTWPAVTAALALLGMLVWKLWLFEWVVATWGAR